MANKRIFRPFVVRAFFGGVPIGMVRRFESRPHAALMALRGAKNFAKAGMIGASVHVDRRGVLGADRRLASWVIVHPHPFGAVLPVRVPSL